MCLSCMRHVSITLEIDAYDKLWAAKRAGESFSDVVRRAIIQDMPPDGAALREHYRCGGGGVSMEYLDAVEQAASP